MDIWLKKYECTGCAACANSCPNGALKMEDDKNGFSYPSIDKNYCINCKACYNSCPIVNKDKKEKRKYADSNEVINSIVYSAWSKNDNTRFSSTSGGIFTELSYAIINEGGWVYGAAYDDQLKVYHKGVNLKESINELRQSKYVQSDIGFVYKDVKEKVKNNVVLFVGTPCQVAGLYNYLGIDSKNLITVEFICYGVNSPKAYRKWIDELEENVGDSVKNIWFKYKEFGWKASPYCTFIEYKNGKKVILNGNNNKYMVGYLRGNWYMRPSCSACKFMNEERVADITLGDFWGIDRKYDDDRGTSLIMINTYKGKELFELSKEHIEYQQQDVSSISSGNPHFYKPIKYNRKEDAFLSELDNKKFSKVVNKYQRRRNCINYIKGLIHKLGL